MNDEETFLAGDDAEKDESNFSNTRVANQVNKGVFDRIIQTDSRTLITSIMGPSIMILSHQ